MNNRKSEYDYNDAERRFDRQSNVMISVFFIIVIAAIAAVVIFFPPSVHCQTIGDAQIGIQEIEVQFHNSYKTDTVVVVGQSVRLRFESPNLYDAPERKLINIVREWPGVEHVIFEDHDEIGSLFGRKAGDAIEIKLYPGYNQIIRLQYGGVLSRRYFVVALRSVPNLDIAGFRSAEYERLDKNFKPYSPANKFKNIEVTYNLGDGVIDRVDWEILKWRIGSRWNDGTFQYDAGADFNSDGRIDALDMVIFEQGKYWR